MHITNFNKGVSIIQYLSPPEKGLASMIYKPILHLQTLHTLCHWSCALIYCGILQLDGYLAKQNHDQIGLALCCILLSDNQNSTPKSEVLFLPIIDLNSINFDFLSLKMGDSFYI